MLNKKLFAFDMDGTLLNTDEKILPESIEAIKEARKKGHKIAIVTGRPYYDAKREIDISLFDYIVANNGAYFYSVNDKKFFYGSSLPKYILKEAINVGKLNKCYIAVHGQKHAERAALAKMDTNFVSEEFKEFEKFRDKFLSPKEIEEFGLKEKMMQISLRSDPKTISEAKDSFNSFLQDIDVFVSNEVYIDINLKGVNKWDGIKKIIKHLGSNYIVYAFGDSSNDLLMLKNAHYSFCMENGNKEAKMSAQKIIGDNNTNSIAQAVKENI